MKFKKFFLQRVLAWALTILIGVTFIFFIPRMFPSDDRTDSVTFR